jgi:hypothetical protein
VAERDVDFLVVTARLRGALEGFHGKLRVTDAIALAGFDRSSFHRTRLLSRAMRELGWDRGRLRFNGALLYAYARGSLLEREVILDVERGDDDRLVVKRREP